jgi:hypothetical protein
MKKQILFFATLLFSVAVFAQDDQKLSTKINGLKPFDMQAIRMNDVLFTISRNAESVKVIVVPRRTIACEDTCFTCNCSDMKIAGKITFSGQTQKEFEQLASLLQKPARRLDLVVANETTGKAFNISLNDNGNYSGVVSGNRNDLFKYIINGQVIARGHAVFRNARDK